MIRKRGEDSNLGPPKAWTDVPGSRTSRTTSISKEELLYIYLTGPSYTHRVMQDTEDDHALDNQDVFSRCKSYFRDTSNAIDGLDSDHKEVLVNKMIHALNELYYEAMKVSRDERGDQSGDMEGQKFAMLPPCSKKRKTHGTKHYS